VNPRFWRSVSLTLLFAALLAGLAPAALAQARRGGAQPAPRRGGGPVPPGLDNLPGLGGEGGTGARSSVVIKEFRVDQAKLWAGDQQKFQTWISVAGDPPRLESLELEVTHPRAGKRVEKKDVLRLTPEQLNGNAPIEWVLPFSAPGLYTCFVRAQGLGSPEIVRFPANNDKSFRVDLLWQVIAWAVGLTVLAFVVAKLLLSGLFSRLVKNQTKVPPFSLICWLVATVVIWWYFFGIWTIWVLVGAGIILLAGLIYVFT
jgi:hypothetical protein